MNKMIVRGATLAMALCLASPALVACGGDSKSDDKTEAGSTATSSKGAEGSGGTDGTGGSDTNGGAPAAGSSPKPKGSLKAVKLPVPGDLSGALQDTYFAVAGKGDAKRKRENVMLPKHVLFGKVTGANGGVQFYAVGDIGFKNDPVSQQDGPHVWKKDDSQNSWSYVGDTGGALCGKVPADLVKAWGKSCN
ncbi:hypothetical protein [Actinomadura oligospora]|uniref:hypothetical protein n=1 Tax=Actinomadura oligospora TaxID=111804 RepID=UPI0004B8EA22|nr:hypothetical protein [Actinomadura oligospora]